MGTLATGHAQEPPLTSVRFHHLHFRVDDPAAAMTDAIARHGGTRVTMPGLGAGVRINDVYVMFERATGEPPAAIGGAADAMLSGRFDAAAKWLAARRVQVAVSTAGTQLLARAARDLELAHIGVAAENVDSVARILQASGATETRRSANSVFFKAADTAIEVTPETEAPDRFWCPMHPDVRAPLPAKCPICAMELVAIAPPRVGEYRFDVAQVPSPDGRGIRSLGLRIRDPETGRDVPMFAEAHERILHLFIIGRDLEYFAHEHPERRGDGFELNVDLPAGAYMLIADFLPGGGYPQMVHRAIVTPGSRVSPFAFTPDPAEDLGDKVANGIRVHLEVDQVSDRPEAVMRFTCTDALTGAPVTDLQLYLGSTGHLLVVPPDLTNSVHAHPEGRTAGPQINFGLVFPRAGVFKVWLQVQRGGVVTSAPFVVRIS